MEIAILAAVDRNGGLGFQGDMAWRGKVPSDMRRFRELTTGHTVIMGRKTFVSLRRPLPNRRNIVITRDITGRRDGAECFTSIEMALTSCEEKKTEKVFVIGGGEIYALFMARVDTMYITRIDGTFPSDTYFPTFDRDSWSEHVERVIEVNEKDSLRMEFMVLKRK